MTSGSFDVFFRQFVTDVHSTESLTQEKHLKSQQWTDSSGGSFRTAVGKTVSQTSQEEKKEGGGGGSDIFLIFSPLLSPPAVTMSPDDRRDECADHPNPRAAGLRSRQPIGRTEGGERLSGLAGTCSLHQPVALSAQQIQSPTFCFTSVFLSLILAQKMF